MNLELLNKCHSVTIMINEHRALNESAEEYLYGKEDIENAVFQNCVKSDNVIEIYIYPNNSVGQIYIIHHDLNSALEEAIDYCENEGVGGEPQPPKKEARCLVCIQHVDVSDRAPFELGVNELGNHIEKYWCPHCGSIAVRDV